MKRRDVEHIFEDGSDPAFDALFAALREPDSIDPAIASTHIAAAAAQAREMPQTAATPTTSRAPWYRRVLVRGAGLGLTAKILLGTAVAVAATGGATAGGFLPGPIQSVIADGASHVGLHLPNPRLATTTTATIIDADDDNPSTGASTTSTTTEPTDDGSAPNGLTPGSYAWSSTACDATPLAVHYTVTADGTLDLDSVVGDADDVDADDDRIRVDFDDVRVDIRIDDEVTVDEDRDCDGQTGSSGTTTTTTTSAPDDDDDDSDGSSAAGSHTWSGTSCDATPISVGYTVTSDDELHLDSITGDVDDVDDDEDRIRVSFEDGIDVEIRIHDGDVTIDVDRGCDASGHDDDAEDEGSPTTTQPSDESDDD